MSEGSATYRVPRPPGSTTVVSLHEWRKQWTSQEDEAFPGSGHQTAQEEELRRLKREREVTRQERDILKKALIVFSRT